MFSPKADGRLQVQIPAPAQDRPSWTKVGVITAIGFIIGIAWPRVMGVRLGPSVPADITAAGGGSASAPASSGLIPETATSLGSAPGAVPAAAMASAPSAPLVIPPDVTVSHGSIFACKNADGDSLKGPDCGTLPGFDSLVMPRLRNLSDCPDAASTTGKVHFIVHLDFTRGALSVEMSKSHGVHAGDALLACAKTNIAGLGLGGVPHDNPRYSVAYTVGFEPAGSASTNPSSSTDAGFPHAPGDPDSTAQVVWEVAIVRDAPKTGKVVARLQRGATVQLGAVRDGWYPVKYGDGFGSDGWLYRGALGR
jgi:hypothetical protein